MPTAASPGVIAKGADDSIQFNAKKGVILAAGDYQNDDEMMDYYLPDLGRKQNNKITWSCAARRMRAITARFFDSNYMTQAEKWPGKLFDPDALKAYMPEESGEKKGVYEDQVATFKADTLDELAKKLGITDAAAFKKSVERYNALAGRRQRRRLR